jgi:hypothetical protein
MQMRLQLTLKEAWRSTDAKSSYPYRSCEFFEQLLAFAVLSDAAVNWCKCEVPLPTSGGM